MTPADPLAQLRDIHLPPPPPFWPPAPGWWLLAGLLLLLLAVAAVYGWRFWRRRQRRRRILDHLDRLGSLWPAAEDAPRLAAEVSVLLKRVALARFPQAAVAGLWGADWLDFLDRTGGGERFRRGPGRLLATLPYAPAGPADTAGLLAAARDWLRRNG